MVGSRISRPWRSASGVRERTARLPLSRQFV